jgi:PBP1b-binding outer membrane lipoprotein LpoB
VKKIILILVLALFINGCSTVLSESNAEAKKRVPTQHNNVILFVAKQGYGADSIRIDTGFKSLPDGHFNGYDNVVIAVKDYGLKTTKNLAHADYVLIIEDSKGDLSGNWNTLFALMTLGIFPLNFEATLVMHAKIVKANDVKSINGTDIQIKDEAKVLSYQGDFSWNTDYLHLWFSPNNFETSIANYEFPLAFQVATEKILTKMEEEYIFDE